MRITLRIRRGKTDEKKRWQEYPVDVPANAYVLDAMEAAGEQDSTLVFRHACHHASCGSCAVRINGRERLPCIVRVREIARPGAVIRLEPLRNFPLIADLAVDRGRMLRNLLAAGMRCIREADSKTAGEGCPPLQQFEDCIECGICISACPIAGSAAEYAGPAALAAAERSASTAWADTRDGVWRCHSVFACTDACPLEVDPAGAIMRLRADILLRRRTNP